jgi:hypothetical protein
MHFKKRKVFWLFILISACNDSSRTNENDSLENLRKGSYAYDVAFLKKYTKKSLELQNGGAKILLSADYQGRVMTSTAVGDTGVSFGWLNYNLISSGKPKKQFNPVGGEERLWLGPEGGQYSLYFKKPDSFTIAYWQVPSIIDTKIYEVKKLNGTEASFSTQARISNYSGTAFQIGIQRTISLLDKSRLEKTLNVLLPPNISFVAYQSFNKIKNNGDEDWKKEKGLLSIWLLGMMVPTENTKVIIPFSPNPDSRNYITDNYFGKIASDRLLVKDSVLYFRCDGKSRSKIGIAPVIAKPVAGSFDFARNILTIIIPEIDKNGPYVNSKWEIQKQPFKGDAINAYNDGPLEDGSQLGPFYEIESSSPARELKKDESLQYNQVTCHFVGGYKELTDIAKKLLGVNLDEIKNW